MAAHKPKGGPAANRYRRPAFVTHYTEVGFGRVRVTIRGTTTARLNQLLSNRWAAARLKKADRGLIALASRGAPPATGKRRVRLTVVLGPRQRAGDPDCYQKSLGDALVHAKMLVDDNRQGVEWAPVAFERGDAPGMVIVLEDIGPGGPAGG
jgi:Holliday junction resolvase RusA-like endonuclease